MAQENLKETQEEKNSKIYNICIVVIVLTLFAPFVYLGVMKQFESEIYNYKLNNENKENVEQYNTLDRMKIRGLKEKEAKNE